MQMKISWFLFLKEELLTVKGWMLPSTSLKGYACQCRVKRKKGRVEKIRGISSFFNVGALPELFSPEEKHLLRFFFSIYKETIYIG